MPDQFDGSWQRGQAWFDPSQSGHNSYGNAWHSGEAETLTPKPIFLCGAPAHAEIFFRGPYLAGHRRRSKAKPPEPPPELPSRHVRNSWGAWHDSHRQNFFLAAERTMAARNWRSSSCGGCTRGLPRFFSSQWALTIGVPKPPKLSGPKNRVRSRDIPALIRCSKFIAFRNTLW